MKRFLIILLVLFYNIPLWAQLKSPEEYFGRKIGSKITPHHRVLEYYKYIASQAPDRVKYEQYGESVEGRPLYVFFVSSTKNIARLEQIRKSNMSIVGEERDGFILEDMPAIIWMSNNAHGNETSS
ncbi:M14 family zinc carboxypeptidase, partial [Sphingobacterium sp. T2]|uniref:M14 family zinc carboxypeptidase n=1 Tax=Sphingobacterium sp. T2 TaxID=1590596 RepID=UPI00057B9694